MKHVLFGMIVAALPIFLASCGGDNSGTGSTQDGATSAAFAQIKSTIDQVNQTNSNGLQIGSSSEKADDLYVSSDKPRTIILINTVVNCSGGGIASVVGSLTVNNTGTNPVRTALNYSYTLTFNHCVTTGLDNNTYTISSTGIVTSGTSNWLFTNVNPADGAFGFDGADSISIAGNVDISGAESLTCDINVAEQLKSTQTGNSLTETGTITGDACGKNYNSTINITETVASGS